MCGLDACLCGNPIWRCGQTGALKVVLGELADAVGYDGWRCGQTGALKVVLGELAGAVLRPNGGLKGGPGRAGEHLDDDGCCGQTGALKVVLGELADTTMYDTSGRDGLHVMHDDVWYVRKGRVACDA